MNLLIFFWARFLLVTIMDFIFLFTGDYFNYKKVDENFLEQFLAFKNAGFNLAIIPWEAIADTAFKLKIPAGAKVVYRSWMLAASEYENPAKIIENSEANLFRSPREYLATHYLPNWYSLIAEFTPETKFYSLEDNLEKELQALDWDSFFIKDYVKSLKTSCGSIIDRPNKIKQVIAEMKKFRGTINGGICIRKVEDFRVDTEKRYFILQDRAFAASPTEVIPDIVLGCAKTIQSKFFSLDLVTRKDGIKRIVEIGEGQVSDLVGCSVERFAEIWQKNINSLRTG